MVSARPTHGSVYRRVVQAGPTRASAARQSVDRIVDEETGDSRRTLWRHESVTRAAACRSAACECGRPSGPRRRFNSRAFRRLARSDLSDARRERIPWSRPRAHRSRSRNPATASQRSACRGEALVRLDRVEALGERRDDVGNDDHVGVLKVRRHVVVRSRRRAGARSAASKQLARLGAERVGPTRTTLSRRNRARELDDELDVEPRLVERPDVDRGRRGRQVVRARLRPPEVVDVDAVRDERDRTDRALASPRAPASRRRPRRPARAPARRAAVGVRARAADSGASSQSSVTSYSDGHPVCSISGAYVTSFTHSTGCREAGGACDART